MWGEKPRQRQVERDQVQLRLCPPRIDAVSLSRALNSLICRALVGVFLFAQLSVAAYACPGQDRAAMANALAPSGEMSAMPADCDQMGQLDQQAPNLCAEHCKFGHQNADTAAAPIVIAPAPALLYMLPDDAAQAKSADPLGRAGDPLLATPPPEHAILHCVLRI